MLHNVHIVHTQASEFCAYSADDASMSVVHHAHMPRKRKVKEMRDPVHHLRAWRKCRDYTQTQLGERAGLHHTTIGRLENGYTDLTRATAGLLAAALKIEVIDLFRDPSDEGGTWRLAKRIEALSPDERRMIERVLASFIQEQAS